MNSFFMSLPIPIHRALIHKVSIKLSMEVNKTYKSEAAKQLRIYNVLLTDIDNFIHYIIKSAFHVTSASQLQISIFNITEIFSCFAASDCKLT